MGQPIVIYLSGFLPTINSPEKTPPDRRVQAPNQPGGLSGWSGIMARVDGGSYDPETVVLLREVLDSAWQTLSQEQRARTQKSDLASRILRLANRGERDPVKLRVGAVTEVVTDRRPRRLGAKAPR
jgi:hypothetical protein